MMSYYDNVNPELLSKIPVNAQSVLEIGCGTGKLGEAFKARCPDAKYFGVELFENAAIEARKVLDGVICTNIEQDTNQVTQLANSFDALVFGDVLEHLIDPWKVLNQLRTFVIPGGVCVACIPNIGHWSIAMELLRGRWNYTNAGLLDRTHLRFFTLDSAVQMFRNSGWNVLDASPRNLWPEKTEEALKVLLPTSAGLGIDAGSARMNMSAFQWVIRATNGQRPNVISLAAIGMKKQAGVTESRVDHPMTALQSLPEVRAVWGSGSVAIPKDMPPGVMVLHRQFLAEVEIRNAMETLAKKGWLLVADIDDDPHHWSEYVDSNFFAFRFVHAVTVSKEYLVGIIRKFNPNVKVLENAILTIPHKERTKPFGQEQLVKKDYKLLRIFFGALNRKSDWLSVMDGITKAALENKDRIEFVVVHDKEFFDSLPSNVSKKFMPTLNIEKYTEVLSSCDIALLPLNDTPLNRCKSDLKFIECASAQVAIICSKIVYAEKPEHLNYAMFATTSEDWHQSITTLVTNNVMREKLVHDALVYVKNNRMHSQQSFERFSYYSNLLQSKEYLEIQRQQRIKQESN